MESCETKLSPDGLRGKTARYLKYRINKKPTDPRVLRAILDLEKAGWARDEISGVFGFRAGWYFYRKAEIYRLRQVARAAN